MTHILREAENLLPRMTRAEKAQLLQWVVSDLGEAFPGIESTPGVCGGEPCIVRTRIPVPVSAQNRTRAMNRKDYGVRWQSVATTALWLYRSAILHYKAVSHSGVAAAALHKRAPKLRTGYRFMVCR